MRWNRESDRWGCPICTVVYHRDWNFLCKNRDKTRATAEEVVQTPSVLAVRTVGADYYSLAINQFGCAFVSTAVNSVSWTQAILAGRTEEAETIFKTENEGLVSPTFVISELMSQTHQVGELLDVLLSGKFKWMGYNVVLADTRQACAVETHRDHVYVRRLEDRDVVTNHFQYLDHGPQKHDDYPSSFERLDYAKNALMATKSVRDVLEVMNPIDEDERQKVWRTGKFVTVSSSVIDIPNLKLCHYQKDGSYQVYQLDSEGVRVRA